MYQSTAPVGNTAPHETTTCIWFTPSIKSLRQKNFAEVEVCVLL